MIDVNRYGPLHCCCCGHELSIEGKVIRDHNTYTMNLANGRQPGRNGGTKRMRTRFRPFALSMCTHHGIARVRWEFLYYFGFRTLFAPLTLRRTNYRGTS